jgi:RNA polymerase sigma factor (TIGR02999 family)
MLLAWRGGDHEALQQLLPLVYGELRRLARHHLRRAKREDTFESKALVHEAYLRLVDQDRVEWRDRTHFFGLASNLMRCILVDHYRTKHAFKRGGNARAVDLAEAEYQASREWKDNIVALDEALTKLAAMDSQQGPYRRAPFLWWPEHRRHRRGGGRLASYREKQVESRSRVAEARAPR